MCGKRTSTLCASALPPLERLVLLSGGKKAVAERAAVLLSAISAAPRSRAGCSDEVEMDEAIVFGLRSSYPAIVDSTVSAIDTILEGGTNSVDFCRLVARISAALAELPSLDRQRCMLNGLANTRHELQMLIALYDALPTPSQKLPEKPLPPELHPQLGASPGAVPGSIPTALSLSALAAHCLTQTYDETPRAAALRVLLQSRVACAALRNWRSSALDVDGRVQASRVCSDVRGQDATGCRAIAAACRTLWPVCQERCGEGSGAGLLFAAIAFEQYASASSSLGPDAHVARVCCIPHPSPPPPSLHRPPPPSLDQQQVTLDR